MKKSNLILGYTTVLFFSFIFYYHLLIENLPVWIFDIKGCFVEMEFKDFILYHLHFFIYILIFVVLTVFLTKGIIKNAFYVLSNFRFYRNLKKLKIKEIGSISLIDVDKKIAFNFGNKIYISKVIFSDKDSLKAVYLHEKEHLKNRDFFRLFAISLMLNFLPKKISDFIKSQFSLFIEVEADKGVVKAFDKNRYAKILLSSYEAKLDIPMFSGYVKSRIENILVGRNIKIKFSKISMIFMSIFTLTLITELLKTCFCGM